MKKIVLFISLFLLISNDTNSVQKAPSSSTRPSTWLSWFKSGPSTPERITRVKNYLTSQWGCFTGNTKCSKRKRYGLRALASAAGIVILGKMAFSLADQIGSSLADQIGHSIIN